VLRHLAGLRRKVRDLMAMRRLSIGPRLGEQGMAVLALLRGVGDEVIHLVGWKKTAILPLVSELAPGIAPAGRLGVGPRSLPGVGRRWFVGVPGIQTEPLLESFDPIMRRLEELLERQKGGDKCFQLRHSRGELGAVRAGVVRPFALHFLHADVIGRRRRITLREIPKIYDLRDLPVNGYVMACCAGMAIASLVILMLVGWNRIGLTQEVTPTPMPTLFALDYKSGHELAGFTGRPMVLIFGDSRVAGWQQFLLGCESNPALARLLAERCQGVFVDAFRDAEALDKYGDPPVPSVLVKDLHGPVFGQLVGEFTPEDLLAVLERALPRIRVEPSPAWARLRAGTDLLDELNEKGEVGEAVRVLGLFRRFEGGTLAYERARDRALRLQIPIQGE